MSITQIIWFKIKYEILKWNDIQECRSAIALRNTYKLRKYVWHDVWHLNRRALRFEFYILCKNFISTCTVKIKEKVLREKHGKYCYKSLLTVKKMWFLNKLYLCCLKNICLFQSVWKKIEKSHKQWSKEKFPPCIKTILANAGYNTFISSSAIDEAKIKEIERHIQLNKHHLNELNCCYSEEYKGFEVFQFLPGHKTILMDLPKRIKTLKGKKTFSDNEIQDKLIASLMLAARKVDSSFQEGIITKKNILNFERIPKDDDFIFKCRFSCPFCEKMYSAKYGNSWMNSNITKHVKGHIQQNRDEEQAEDRYQHGDQGVSSQETSRTSWSIETPRRIFEVVFLKFVCFEKKMLIITLFLNGTRNHARNDITQFNKTIMIMIIA